LEFSLNKYKLKNIKFFKLYLKNSYTKDTKVILLIIPRIVYILGDIEVDISGGFYSVISDINITQTHKG